MNGSFFLGALAVIFLELFAAFAEAVRVIDAAQAARGTFEAGLAQLGAQLDAAAAQFAASLQAFGL
jgi:hypothetical protein